MTPNKVQLEEKIFSIETEQKIQTFKMESIEQNQKEIKESVKKIEESLLNPEKGVISRIRSLEKTKSLWSKLFWIFVTCGMGTVITIFGSCNLFK